MFKVLFIYTLIPDIYGRIGHHLPGGNPPISPTENSPAALEFAFLAFETKQPIEARRVFDKLRKTGTPATRKTAEQAFQNIDAPRLLPRRVKPGHKFRQNQKIFFSPSFQKT
jgi:hypothetical protein